MGKKKVSIIMGIYNCENTLATAIDSIINQTFTNWELIMCDDGSKDNTYQIAQQYQKKYPSKIILLKNEKNLRLAATLNRCLKVAKGEYIARMDGDDICRKERFEIQVAFLESHPEYDCVGAGREVFDENGVNGIRLSKEYPTKNDIFKSVPFAHPTIMMKKSTYDALGGYRESSETLRAEDLDLWFRFWQMGFNGYNLQDILLEYREGVNDFRKRTLQAAIGTTKVYLKYWKEYNFGFRFLPWCCKPIITALLPNSLMHKYHKIKDGKK